MAARQDADRAANSLDRIAERMKEHVNIARETLSTSTRAADSKAREDAKHSALERQRRFYEHGPKPTLYFGASTNIEKILRAGVAFYNSGPSEASVVSLMIEGHDFSEKVAKTKIPANREAVSPNEDRIRIFSEMNKEVLLDIVRTAESKGSVTAVLKCDAFEIQEIVLTEQRISRDALRGKWQLGEASITVETGNSE
jgi:hypothetical protein